MFARVATFEGGDPKRLRELNEERMSAGTINPPSGAKRALLLQGERRLFITFFDSRDEIAAAEARFDQMGDEIPEEIRGRRISVDVYEVLLDSEL